MDLYATLVIVTGTLIGCAFGLSWFAGSDAPYVPTKIEKAVKLLKMLDLKKGQQFYELGSGDGRVVLEAAKLGLDALGIEQSWMRVIWSKFQAYQQKLPNAKFKHGNIINEDLSRADIVYIYLLPKGVSKLSLKLKRELKKGSLIITQTFHFKDWVPIKKIDLPGKDFINGGGNFWIYRV